MEMEQSHMTERILNLTLEIVYLLTGENYIAFKLSDGMVASNLMKTPSLVRAPLSPPQSKNKKKVQEVSSKIIELLTGEVAVDVNLSDLRIEISEEAEDLYVSGEEPFKEKESPPEISTDPGDTRGTHKDVKAEEEEEEEVEHVRIKVEEIPSEISTDGQQNRTNVVKFPFITEDCKTEDDEVIRCEVNGINPNLHLMLPGADLLSDPFTQMGSFPDFYPPITHHMFYSGDDTLLSSDRAEHPTQREDLTSHPRLLTEEMPFSCSQCGKCFTRKAYLAKHQRIHVGLTPFSCSECGKCFTRRTSLINHQRTHTGVKPYSCPECGKCFTWRTTFIEHQRSHTGVNSPIKQSDAQSSSNEENDNNGCSKSVGHVSEMIAATVEDKHSIKKKDKLKKSDRSMKEHKKETSSKNEGPSKFVETFGECIKIKTAYDTAHKSTPESQQKHKSEIYTPKSSKQSKTHTKEQHQAHQKQQPNFGKCNVRQEDNSEVRVSKTSKSHPETRPPMESSQQSPVSPQVPKQVPKLIRSDVMSSSPASPEGDESSTESELENTAVRPAKKILLEKKRIRNRKFTFHENLVLIENLVPHFHKLLGNRAAATESAWKNTIWKQIAAAVTSVGVCPRSADQVRKRYQDIRHTLRRKISNENKSRKATGGGPKIRTLYHQYEELLRPYIDLDSIVGIKAGYDSSRHHESEQQNSAQHIYRQQKLSFMNKLNELLQTHLSSPGELSQNVTSSNHSSCVSESFTTIDANVNFSSLDI